MNPILGKNSPIMPFDLGYHSAFSVPRLCLVPEINQPDLNPTLGRSSHRTCQVRLNRPIQDLIRGEPDEVGHPLTLAILIQLGHGKRRVTSEPEKPETRSIPLHDGIEQIENAVG